MFEHRHATHCCRFIFTPGYSISVSKAVDTDEKCYYVVGIQTAIYVRIRRSVKVLCAYSKANGSTTACCRFSSTPDVPFLYSRVVAFQRTTAGISRLEYIRRYKFHGESPACYPFSSFLNGWVRSLFKGHRRETLLLGISWLEYLIQCLTIAIVLELIYL